MLFALAVDMLGGIPESGILNSTKLTNYNLLHV